MSGAPEGNINATKGMEYRQALRRAMAHRSGTTSKALEELAEKCIEAAMDGEQWAIKEIADRFDGKPAQSLTLSGDPDSPLVTKVSLGDLDDRSDSSDTTET